MGVCTVSVHTNVVLLNCIHVSLLACSSVVQEVAVGYETGLYQYSELQSMLRGVFAEETSLALCGCFCYLVCRKSSKAEHRVTMMLSYSTRPTYTKIY